MAKKKTSMGLRLLGLGAVAVALVGVFKLVQATNPVKPTVTVSPNGPDIFGDYGPNTPGTVTAGILEALATGGGVFIRNGTYLTTRSISTYGLAAQDIQIEGESISGTIVKQAANAGIGFMFSTHNPASGASPGTPLKSLTMRNMTWDFNYANQPQTPTVDLYGGSGKYLRAGGAGSVGLTLHLADAQTTTVENVRAMNGGSYAFHLGFVNGSANSATDLTNGVVVPKVFARGLWGVNNYNSLFMTSAPPNGYVESDLQQIVCENDLAASIQHEDGYGWNVSNVRIRNNVSASQTSMINILGGSYGTYDDIEIDATGNPNSITGITAGGFATSDPPDHLTINNPRIINCTFYALSFGSDLGAGSSVRGGELVGGLAVANNAIAGRLVIQGLQGYAPSLSSITAGTSPYTFPLLPYDASYVLTTVGGIASLTLDSQELFNGSFSVGQNLFVRAGHTLIAIWAGSPPVFTILPAV